MINREITLNYWNRIETGHDTFRRKATHQHREPSQQQIGQADWGDLGALRASRSLMNKMSSSYGLGVIQPFQCTFDDERRRRPMKRWSLAEGQRGKFEKNMGGDNILISETIRLLFPDPNYCCKSVPRPTDDEMPELLPSKKQSQMIRDPPFH